LPGDLGVRQPGAEATEHVALAFGELIQDLGGGRWGGGEGTQQPPGHLWV
jgi:hypothetical protein